MKLLYFGDFHHRQKAPVSRIDDWESSIDAKIAEIKQLAATNNVAALLQPGDFLDSPKVSDEYVYQIIAKWSNLDVNQLVLRVISGELTPEDLYREIKQSIPKIGIIGNHELFGHSNKAFNKTSLSLLNQIGFMNLVTKENPIILKSEEGFTIAITGANYHADIDRDTSHQDYLVEKKLGDFHIHLVHGYGTNLDFGDLIPHTKIQELGATQADLTIIGHDHIGFDPIEVNGKWFVNPGAPVRLSNDAKEMARQPKVMLIDFNKNGFKLDVVPLASAKDSNLVLDRSKIEHKHEQQQKLDEIKDTIKNANVGKGENIVEIVENISNGLNIPDEIKNDVRELISKKAQNLSSATKAPTKYFIKSLELKNFQSHEHSFFEFSEGLNVFTGESRSGKTSVVRALGWIYEDYGGASRRFIKTGAKSAEATIVLSNGYIITRIVESRAGGFNGYKVFHPAKGEWETMNTKAIGLIQEILGFSPLQIDKTENGKVETIPLNFLRQGNSWFFIGDDTTGSQRAKIIGTICGTNVADAAIREVESKNKELSLLLKSVDKEIVGLDIEVGCMTHVEALHNDIETAEKLMEEMVELLERKIVLENSKNAIDSLKTQAAKLKVVDADLKKVVAARQVVTSMLELAGQKSAILDIQEKFRTYNAHCAKLEKITVALKPLREAQAVVSGLMDLAKTKTAIVKAVDETNAITQTGKALKKFVSELPKTSAIGEKVTELKALYEKKATILSYHDGLVVNAKQQSKLSVLIESLNNVEKAKKIIADVHAVVETKKAIEAFKKTTDGIDKDIAAEQKNVSDYTKQIKTVKVDYMDVFAKVDKCPLCLHDITRDDAISIAKNKFAKE